MNSVLLMMVLVTSTQRKYTEILLWCILLIFRIKSSFFSLENTFAALFPDTSSSSEPVQSVLGYFILKNREVQLLSWTLLHSKYTWCIKKWEKCFVLLHYTATTHGCFPTSLVSKWTLVPPRWFLSCGFLSWGCVAALFPELGNNALQNVWNLNTWDSVFKQDLVFPLLPAPNAMGEGMVLICVCCGAGSACRDERRVSLPALAVGAHGVGSSMAGPGQDKARALHTGKELLREDWISPNKIISKNIHGVQMSSQMQMVALFVPYMFSCSLPTLTTISWFFPPRNVY